MDNLETVLKEAFQNFPDLESIFIYVNRFVKLKNPIGRLSTHFITIEASYALHVKKFEDVMTFINPILLTFQIDKISVDKHNEKLHIELKHIVEEERDVSET